MILTGDYHTHTVYSDGENTISENAACAKELGIGTIAITEHGFTHLVFGLRRKQKEEYVREIHRARDETGINVLVGIEGNVCGLAGRSDLKEEDYADFDIFLAGFHLMSQHDTPRDFFNSTRGYFKYHWGGKPSARLVADTTRSYINAIQKNPIDVITHLNYECFADAVEVAKCCRDEGTYIEISGKKPHLSDEELVAVAETGVRFLVNSDAHSVTRIGDVAIALEQLQRVGIPFDRVDNIEGRVPVFRLAQYKERHL